MKLEINGSRKSRKQYVHLLIEMLPESLLSKASARRFHRRAPALLATNSTACRVDWASSVDDPINSAAKKVAWWSARSRKQPNAYCCPCRQNCHSASLLTSGGGYEVLPSLQEDVIATILLQKGSHDDSESEMPAQTVIDDRLMSPETTSVVRVPWPGAWPFEH